MRAVIVHSPLPVHHCFVFLYLVILSFLADFDSDSELPELPGGESDSDSDAEGRPSAKKRNTAGPWGRRLVVFS